MCYVRAWEHEEWGRFGSFEMLLVRHCWFQNFFVRVLSRRRLRFLGMEGCCGCCWSMGVQAVLLPLTVAWLLISDLLCWRRGGGDGFEFFCGDDSEERNGRRVHKKMWNYEISISTDSYLSTRAIYLPGKSYIMRAESRSQFDRISSLLQGT